MVPRKCTDPRSDEGETKIEEKVTSRLVGGFEGGKKRMKRRRKDRQGAGDDLPSGVLISGWEEGADGVQSECDGRRCRVVIFACGVGGRGRKLQVEVEMTPEGAQFLQRRRVQWQAPSLSTVTTRSHAQTRSTSLGYNKNNWCCEVG